MSENPLVRPREKKPTKKELAKLAAIKRKAEKHNQRREKLQGKWRAARLRERKRIARAIAQDLKRVLLANVEAASPGAATDKDSWSWPHLRALAALILCREAEIDTKKLRAIELRHINSIYSEALKDMKWWWASSSIITDVREPPKKEPDPLAKLVRAYRRQEVKELRARLKAELEQQKKEMNDGNS